MGRQPNSAAIMSLRFVNPLNLRTRTYHRLILLFCYSLIVSKFSLLIWEVIGTSWPSCTKKPFCMTKFVIPHERQIFDCAMYGQNFDHHLDRADFGHPVCSFSNAYGQIWTLTCVLCMYVAKFGKYDCNFSNPYLHPQ